MKINERVKNIEEGLDKVIKKFFFIEGEFKSIKGYLTALIFPVYAALIVGVIMGFFEVFKK